MPTLDRINVTPVKGMALHHPDQVEITPAGIPGDRRFYLVDDATARWSAAARFGPLVQIIADHDPQTEELSMRFPDGTVVADRADRLGRRGSHRLLPATGRGPRRPWALVRRGLRVHGHARCGCCVAISDGEAVDVLAAHRGLDRVRPTTSPSAGTTTEPLDSRRFRINLELDGCEPYDEDSWDGHTVGIGDVQLRI